MTIWQRECLRFQIDHELRISRLSSQFKQALMGGIVDFEAPLDYSNVMLVCPHCGRPTRTMHTVLESGARVLVCRHCGEPYERVRKTEAQ